MISFQDGASVWEEFYAKEIAKIVDEAEPGTEINLDVTKLTEIAFGNGKSTNEIFLFNNLNNEIVVSLTRGSGTAFNFFNDVDVVEWKVELISGGAETNRLHFKILESQK